MVIAAYEVYVPDVHVRTDLRFTPGTVNTIWLHGPPAFANTLYHLSWCAIGSVTCTSEAPIDASVTTEYDATIGYLYHASRTPQTQFAAPTEPIYCCPMHGVGDEARLTPHETCPSSPHWPATTRAFAARATAHRPDSCTRAPTHARIIALAITLMRRRSVTAPACRPPP